MSVVLPSTASGALALQQQMTEPLAAMSAAVDELNSKIERAYADGQLMKSAAGLSPGSGQPN